LLKGCKDLLRPFSCRFTPVQGMQGLLASLELQDRPCSRDARPSCVPSVVDLLLFKGCKAFLRPLSCRIAPAQGMQDLLASLQLQDCTCSRNARPSCVPSVAGLHLLKGCKDLLRPFSCRFTPVQGMQGLLASLQLQDRPCSRDARTSCVP
jgi:hypothetical protein